MEMTIPEGTRILVVDDEPVVLDVSVSLLEARGLEVRTAMTVAEALEVLEQDEPALALIDKNLPDGTGLEVLQALHTRWPDAQAILFTGYPSFDSAVEALRLGAFDYIVKPLRDVSELWHKVRLGLERRVLLMERERTLREMEEAMRLQKTASHSQGLARLGRMVSGLIHELRSPLTYVLGNVEVVLQQLEAEPLDREKARHGLEEAVEGIGRMTEMMKEVREVSRVEAHDPVLMDDVPVAALVASVVSLTRGQIKSRARVEVEVEPGLVVRGARVRLLQVLVNLVLNAGEALDHPGTIRVRGRREGDRVLLEVEDDGPGIPEEARPHLFEPFFTTKSEGTGLGLALSRDIVDHHGGRIDFESEPGRGTRFVVELPALARSAGAA